MMHSRFLGPTILLACLPMAVSAQSTANNDPVVVEGMVMTDTEFAVVVAEEGSEPLHWNSDSLDFALDDMAEGEQRTSVGPDGQQTSVTRHANGYTINVDGRDIELPMHAERALMLALAEETHGHDMDIRIVGDAAMPGTGRIVKAAAHDGVMIISDEPLDQSVQESIRSVLISAGIDDEVRFINGGTESSQHEKRIEIRREVQKKETP